jgi:hypothetical protein
LIVMWSTLIGRIDRDEGDISVSPFAALIFEYRPLGPVGRARASLLALPVGIACAQALLVRAANPLLKT